MARTIKIILCLITGLFFLSFSCFADEGTAAKQGLGQRLVDDFSSSYSSAQSSVKSFLNDFFEGSEVKTFLAVSEIFDNNVHLNSRRKADAFTQIIFRPRLITPLNENTKRTFTYELMGSMYGDENNLNLITNKLSCGLEHKLNEDLTLTGQYSFGVIDYPNTGIDDFVDHVLGFTIKQNLQSKIYHSLRYNLSLRRYSQRRERTCTGVDTEDKRHDARNSVGYVIGKYFPNDLLKISYHYFNNNSNDDFLKYYDYDSFQPGITLTHFFNKKTFCHTAFAKQMRYFRSRTTSTDANFKEWDRTYVGVLGLYYSPKKSFTIGINYIYRQNNSNEPLENYSGSTVSVNTYYNF